MQNQNLDSAKSFLEVTESNVEFRDSDIFEMLK